MTAAEGWSPAMINQGQLDDVASLLSLKFKVPPVLHIP
jgi:hypothetical protein